MPALLKQPLLHFLVLGLLLFVVYGRVSDQSDKFEGGSAVSSHIRVDRSALLNYMQYQAKAFDTAAFSKQLDAMSNEERQSLIDAYVREEALYRDALRLGMDEGDYIIRQRLVQKLEFLLENIAADSINPTESELKGFYEAHVSDYKVDPVYTFTHVFLDAEKAGMEAARNNALGLMPELKGRPFADASQFGDRFPFLQNYVERTRDFIVNNFGEAFVVALDGLAIEGNQWQGPIQSRYGYHLVMLVQRSEASTPSFEQVKERVLDDFRYESLAHKREEAEAEVVKTYDVSVELEQ